jgi:site-specific DNA-methyltransferase (adenine-specific)
MSNLQLFKYSLVWHKTTPTGFLNAKKMPLRTHEDILVFYKKPPTYNPQKTQGHERKVSKAKHKTHCINTLNYGEHGLTTYDSTERYPTSILTFSTDKQRESYHSTQKPIALFEYLIRTNTNEENIVLDNCSGSFTTACACDNLNRKWICMELDDGYCQIGKDRVNKNRDRLGMGSVDIIKI